MIIIIEVTFNGYHVCPPAEEAWIGQFCTILILGTILWWNCLYIVDYHNVANWLLVSLIKFMCSEFSLSGTFTCMSSLGILRGGVDWIVLHYSHFWVPILVEVVIWWITKMLLSWLLLSFFKKVWNNEIPFNRYLLCPHSELQRRLGLGNLHHPKVFQYLQICIINNFRPVYLILVMVYDIFINTWYVNVRVGFFLPNF